MKERKPTKQMVSVIVALVMIIGCLANLPMMAGAVNGTTVAEDTNTATVYYNNSSFTNAYIHYQVDNGSWTSVPNII